MPEPRSSVLAAAAALRTALQEASPEELPGLIGELETAKATAWARILQPPGSAEARPVALDGWLTPQQAAAIAGVGRRTIYDWAVGKAWASRPSRRCLRIAETTFRRWLAARDH